MFKFLKVSCGCLFVILFFHPYTLQVKTLRVDQRNWTIPRCDSRSSLFNLHRSSWCSINIYTALTVQPCFWLTLFQMKAAYNFGSSSTNNIEGDKYLLNLMLFNASLQVDASQYAEKEKKKSIFAQVIPYILLVALNSPLFVTHGKADFFGWSNNYGMKFCASWTVCWSHSQLSRSWGGRVWDEVHAQRKSINQ